MSESMLSTQASCRTCHVEKVHGVIARAGGNVGAMHCGEHRRQRAATPLSLRQETNAPVSSRSQSACVTSCSRPTRSVTSTCRACRDKSAPVHAGVEPVLAPRLEDEVLARRDAGGAGATQLGCRGVAGAHVLQALLEQRPRAAVEAVARPHLQSTRVAAKRRQAQRKTPQRDRLDHSVGAAAAAARRGAHFKHQEGPLAVGAKVAALHNEAKVEHGACQVAPKAGGVGRAYAHVGAAVTHWRDADAHKALVHGCADKPRTRLRSSGARVTAVEQCAQAWATLAEWRHTRATHDTHTGTNKTGKRGSLSSVQGPYVHRAARVLACTRSGTRGDSGCSCHASFLCALVLVREVPVRRVRTLCKSAALLHRSAPQQVVKAMAVVVHLGVQLASI